MTKTKYVVRFSVLIILGLIVITSCNKKDEFPPDLVLLGDNPMTITLGQKWENPGSVADDNMDKDITNKVVVTHNIPIEGYDNGNGKTTRTGTYTVTYTISDEAGNTTVLTRTVYVVNSIEKYMGDFLVSRKGGQVTGTTNNQIATDYGTGTSVAKLEASLKSDNKVNWKFKISNLSNIKDLTVNAKLDSDGRSILIAPDNSDATIFTFGDTIFTIIPSTNISNDPLSYFDTLTETFYIKYLIQRELNAIQITDVVLETMEKVPGF